MKAYWVARSKILDPIKYKKYTDQVPEIISKFGGKVLARGGNFKILEGTDWMAKKSQGAPKKYDAFATLKDDSSKERPSTKKLNELF